MRPYLGAFRLRPPCSSRSSLRWRRCTLLGLVDDKRALDPIPSCGATIDHGVLVLGTHCAILTALGSRGPRFSRSSGSGSSPRVQFLDNMDGLSGGDRGVVAGVSVTTLVIGQLSSAAALALLLGACLGFLCFNFAPASISWATADRCCLGFSWVC